MSLIPVNQVSADGNDPVWVDVCILPEDKKGFSAGLLFAVSDESVYGKGVQFGISGLMNPNFTDFGLIRNFGRHNYIIPDKFDSSWAKKQFRLKVNRQTLYVHIFNFQTADKITMIYSIPSISDALELQANGNLNPCPQPWPRQ